jgi:2-oxoisovalerate dehydrogenase E2 component (dihydrolipoyl transacylase)
MKIFNLPDLGEGLPDAEIREWYVKEGEEVKVDQPMVAMETAKAVVDVPAPRAGKILKLYGKAGDVINTGAPLVEFADGDVAHPAKEKAATVVGNLESSDTVLVESATGIKPQETSGAVKAMPAVRALAKKLNVDLTKVSGSGANGQITLDDVERASSHAPAAAQKTVGTAEVPAGYEAVRGVRKAMAAAMTLSHQEVVPVFMVDDADIHAWPEKTDTTARMVRALVVACKAQPGLNAWYDGKSNSRLLHQVVHLGLAVDTEEGLFVPVIKDVHQQDAAQLRANINKIKEQVKSRTIPQEDLKGATIILSNVGVFAGRYANPIIVPPIVSILATGRIYSAAVENNGKLELHRMLPLSLTFDHRVVTGGEGARFLAAMIADLQKKD